MKIDWDKDPTREILDEMENWAKNPMKNAEVWWGIANGKLKEERGLDLGGTELILKSAARQLVEWANAVQEQQLQIEMLMAELEALRAKKDGETSTGLKDRVSAAKEREHEKYLKKRDKDRKEWTSEAMKGALEIAKRRKEREKSDG